MLIKKVDAAYPGKFSFTMNTPEMLAATVPSGEGFVHPDTGVAHAWRKGAFEVMLVDTMELLYSKKEEGEHLVDGKGGPESKMAQFVNFLQEIN